MLLLIVLYDRRYNRSNGENAFQCGESVQKTTDPIGLAVDRYEFQTVVIIDMDMGRAQDDIQKIML